MIFCFFVDKGFELINVLLFLNWLLVVLGVCFDVLMFLFVDLGLFSGIFGVFGLFDGLIGNFFSGWFLRF